MPGQLVPSPEEIGVIPTIYDCIIVDCNETAQSLRAFEKYKYIPLVMLTPTINVSFRSALEDGISSYMSTPCTVIDLGNALIPALEGRSNVHISKNSKTFNILLAEDNLVNQRLAVRILEKYHHNVTVANNGLEALEAIQQRRFDVILMDVQMPIMGGFEATANIRDWERSNGLTKTPIIALTAHAMVGDREKCIDAQMDEYLSKPLKPNQLIQTILKCATLESDFNVHDLRPLGPSSYSKLRDPDGTPKKVQRPSMEIRAYTQPPEHDESPRILSIEPTDIMDKVFFGSHSV